MSRFTKLALAAIAVGSLECATLKGAAAATQVVALTGDAAPDGNGLLQFFQTPSLNDAHQAAFLADLTGAAGGSSDDRGIFRSDATVGGLVQIVREGQAAPDNNGTYAFLSAPAINLAGQVAFTSTLSGTTGGTSDNFGIYRGAGAALTQFARRGQAAPDGVGSFHLFTDPGLNDSGRIVSKVIYSGTGGTPGDDHGLIRGNEFTLAQLARTGQPAPDGNGVFSQILDPAINNNALVSFFGEFTGTSAPNPVADDQGIYLTDGVTLTQVARENEPAPGGGEYDFFIGGIRPAINNNGHVAFFSYVSGVPTHTSRGIYRYDGPVPGVAMLVRAGDAAPDGNGTLFELSDPVLNDTGQVLFLGTNMAGTESHLDDRGLFRTDGTPGSLTQIVREDQPAPDGNGRFENFLEFSLNDFGQAAFMGFLRDTAGGVSDAIGLYFYDDDQGLRQVARIGDSMLGSTIEVLDFRGGTNGNANERDGFNVAGEVAYCFDLADGRSGVAIWSPVDPGDFDADGDVDGSDFLRWQRGESPDPLSPEDLADWQANFGAGATASVHYGGTAAADFSRGAVPEPSSLMLMACSAFVFGRHALVFVGMRPKLDEE